MMIKDLTPEQVKAARALLAWSQAQLAAEAKVATSTVADFERKARTPVANNAQAIREALEAQGLEFYAGGVVDGRHMPARPPQARAGKLMRWVDATDLDQWADRRDAQSGMAELLRRLIYAQVGPGASVRFPSDESVQFSGWDGICSSTVSTEYIPGGKSGWEIGTTGRNLSTKATSDLEKRLADPGDVDPTRDAFVFVTPRRFAKKDSWLAANRSKWRDLRVIDADDLVHWLELAPAVAQWLAVRIGCKPDGLQNLEEVWEEWSKGTELPLTPSVLLVDRDAQAAEIHKWVMGDPTLLSVHAESPQEAIAFLYASLNQFPEEYRLAFWSRCVVASTQEMARQLVGLGTPLIVVLPNPDPGLAGRLSESGHHVFAAFGPDVGRPGNTTSLPRPWTHNLEAELKSVWPQDEKARQKAHQYARACGRSLTVLRRLAPLAAIPLPKWASQTPPQLLAAMLAGSWAEDSEIDCRILSNIAGCSYEEVEKALAPLTVIPDSPLQRIGGVWKVVSLRDLWVLLAPQLTPSLLKRFNAAFQEVLGTRNPRFEGAAQGAWFERPGQYPLQASSALRRGLAEAMIALGVYPRAARGIPGANQFADQAVKELLGKADAHLWWSLTQDFRRLAEASPASFLEAVHAALEGESPRAMSLLRRDGGPLFPREYLAELLWALEMLARSQDHLRSAALALARLAELDPPGENKMGNRPAESLRDVFLCWAPQTSATLEQRLKVIDAILKLHPEVGWKLLVGLAPHVYEVMTPTPQPDWRDFSPDCEEEITHGALRRAYREIGKRLLRHVGSCADRWRALFDLWMRFEPTWRDDAVEQLKGVVQEIETPEELEAIRDGIRNLLFHHREFPEADWAKPEEELAPLQEVFDSLKPNTAEERHRWLFNAGLWIMRHGRTWEEANAELEAEQRAAAKELLTELSAEGFIKFAGTVKNSSSLGVAIVEAGAPDDLQVKLLRTGLDSVDNAAIDLAQGILMALCRSRGVAVLDELWDRAQKEAWGERAELQLVGLLPIGSDTWKRVQARSSSLDQAYWKSLNVYRVQDGADLTYIADRLIREGRASAALHLLGNHLKENPPSEILVRALQAAAKEDPPSSSNDAVMFTHYLTEILDHLERDPSTDSSAIAGLEWTYFEALRYSKRRPRVLFRVLAENPDFFADLIKLLYRPSEESGIQEPPAENPELASQLATQAFGVLSEWTWVPGADEFGAIDSAALENWTTKARKICKDSGRLGPGDRHIGQVFARAIRKPGELRPPEEIRDLIEVVRSKDLERGLEIGIYNRRGVTTRAPFDGGRQERTLAMEFRREAAAIRFDHQRTAACLERIAESYEREALRQDQEAEHRDWM